MWSNVKHCEVIRRQVNRASTCLNQISGSAGQKGGSFWFTVAMGRSTSGSGSRKIDSAGN